MTGDTDAESGTRIYKTRIVKSGFNGDEAVNYFADPDEAKRYLEAYIEERLNAMPTHWREERSADEKWSMGIVPEQHERAVVMGVDVHESADEPLDAMREILEEMGVGA